VSNKKKTVSVGPFAHGAVKPVRREGEWIYFGSTIVGDDYPVVFRVEQLPGLIAWLSRQVPASDDTTGKKAEGDGR
jgi:hypothetical protein